jgi:hypothetical protein
VCATRRRHTHLPPPHTQRPLAPGGAALTAPNDEDAASVSSTPAGVGGGYGGGYGGYSQISERGAATAGTGMGTGSSATRLPALALAQGPPSFVVSASRLGSLSYVPGAVAGAAAVGAAADEGAARGSGGGPLYGGPYISGGGGGGPHSGSAYGSRRASGRPESAGLYKHLLQRGLRVRVSNSRPVDLWIYGS